MNCTKVIVKEVSTKKEYKNENLKKMKPEKEIE